MEFQNIDGWDYIDSIRNKSRGYIEVAKEFETSGNGVEAAKRYKQAADLISKMVEDLDNKKISLLQGMIMSANMLRIDGINYAKKAEKLRKSEKSLFKRIFRR